MTMAPRSLLAALTALAALFGVLLLGTPAVAQGASLGVTATPSPTTSGAIEVSWTPVSGAVGYIVVPQRLRTTGEWAAVADRAERLTTARPVVFDGLVDGASYRACVAAVTPDGYVTATSASAVPYGLPDAPVITDVARVGTTLEITWTAPAGNGRPVTSYTLAISPADVAEQAVAGNQTSAIIEGIDAQAAYTVTLRATNLRGQSPAASSGITTTVPVAADAGVAAPVITVTALLPAPSADLGDAGASVRTVSDAGPCAGAVGTGGTTGGDGTNGTGGGPASGGSTAAPGGSGTNAPEGTTSGATRPRLPGTGVGTTEDSAAAEGSGAAPPQRPESGAAPAAPESAAPEAAASGDAAAPSETGTSRRSRWIVGLLVLASAVIAAPMLARRARGVQSVA